MKPRVFVGSSSEGLGLARAVQQNLDDVAEVTVWTDDVFALSRSIYDSLEKALAQFQFGVFVLTPDDSLVKRHQRKRAARDNVVFELGLFAGRLGLARTFLLYPRDTPLHVPTDLLGISAGTYEVHADNNLRASLGAPCASIRTRIAELTDQGIQISWDELCELVNIMAIKLRRSPAIGGFSFDVLVGISRGGITVADLLSRHFGGNIPIVSIWADRHSCYPQINFEPPGNWINSHVIDALAQDRIRNILVVDDVSRTGDTLKHAREFLIKYLPNKVIKTAVLVINSRSQGSFIDYAATTRDMAGVRTPFARVE